MVSLTLKCCSSKHYFHRLVKYVTFVLSNIFCQKLPLFLLYKGTEANIKYTPLKKIFLSTNGIGLIFY